MCKMVKAVTQYKKALCVCGGYQLYKNIWAAVVCETVVCMIEPVNFHDRNTIAVENTKKSSWLSYGSASLRK